MQDIKPHFVDLNPAVIEGLFANFGDIATYAVADICSEVSNGDILVSAGNSFGLMDGGIDLAVARRWPGLETRVQSEIDAQWGAALPVGAAISFPWPLEGTDGFTLLYAPTMPVPQNIVPTPNVFLAMSAILKEAKRIEGRRLICSGLGTLSGGMLPRQAAWQMRQAWDMQGSRPKRWVDVVEIIGR